ncbi:thymosin beta-like isoform X1 [Limulus polyphemus]|uniref:Thymosin beta-like isoform X1 n=1 Tax=Limulus polyphemus TaxID=6850 RepID=A0ABM1TM33_LIMPO|nr:thymosin beta-like isoform X1 [Limulus polyphemus]XP_022256939.1 thymosin beta-like isoform X1 [Limulus polyphemus]XP_022256940.1 thymosin beta-like isoform X1 [Limulus polyphemus]
MSSPKKDLPLLPPAIKGELAQFDSTKLKQAETKEIQLLPSNEDVEKENIYNSLLQNVEGFQHSTLYHIQPQKRVHLPSAEVFSLNNLDLQRERRHYNLMTGVEKFNKSSLHHVKTTEKCVLPNSEDIEREKDQQKLLEEIKSFDTSNMKHSEMTVKNPLPTKDVMDQYKRSN